MSEKLKTILKISIIAIVSTTIITLLVLILIPKNYNRVTVTNQNTLSSLSRKEFNDFREELLNLLEVNNLISETEKVSDVTVREDTVSSISEYQTDGKLLRTTTFLIDIDSLKQTYSVLVFGGNVKMPGYTTQITCPLSSETHYPDSKCNGLLGNSSSTFVRNNLPHELKLASGEKILIKKLEVSKDHNQVLQIYLYSCDDNAPPISKTQTAVKDWVKSLGDKSVDTYTYNVRSGYCTGDAI